MVTPNQGFLAAGTSTKRSHNPRARRQTRKYSPVLFGVLWKHLNLFAGIAVHDADGVRAI